MFKKALIIALAMVGASFAPALAQTTAAQTVPGYYATTGTNCTVGPCFVPYGAAIPVVPSSGSSGTALAGTQTGLAIVTATALTIPSGATTAIIQAQGTNNTSGVCLYWRDDATNPTASTGQAMSALQTMTYQVTGLPIKLIAATGATCTVTVSYYQ